MSRDERRYVTRHPDLPFTFTPTLLTNEVGKIGDSLTDTRVGKNTQYSMRDFLLSAFSVFFMQSPSFLEYQQSMETKYGRSAICWTGLMQRLCFLYSNFVLTGSLRQEVLNIFTVILAICCFWTERGIFPQIRFTVKIAV